VKGHSFLYRTGGGDPFCLGDPDTAGWLGGVGGGELVFGFGGCSCGWVGVVGV